ncbi:hypothetical protein VTJ83DRAFT_5326 [Remersonia thermophila]|uniref:FAD-dependent oxidoreductase-like enzyme n=1 Tax=Remersonia thermophila TaxID=72144 RepID=A0ABR4D6I9_9PEZI
MAADSSVPVDHAVVHGGLAERRPSSVSTDPATPLDNESVPSSRSSMASTQPNSPAHPIDAMDMDLSDDAADAAAAATASVVPSSLTPPPSSQLPLADPAPAVPAAHAGSQRSAVFSPPATAGPEVKRESVPVECAAPTPAQIAEASPEELRAMLQASLVEQARLKMEAAHHKLQYNMLSIRAEEDTKRAAVEHEMTRKEVQALQQAECARQARRDITAAAETAYAKYLQLKVLHEQLLEENEALHKKVKAAKKVIQLKEDEIANLMDEREMLLNRIRENRDHFRILCSPGGMFHGAVTPKQQAGSPQQHRSTPRQTPRSHRDGQRDHAHLHPHPHPPPHHQHHQHHHQEGFAVLLQALSQDNNSAPSTPLLTSRSAVRPSSSSSSSRHTRNVQSMSSLPSTPQVRTGNGRGLLPGIDLVPHTEPPHRNPRFLPDTPTTPVERHHQRRKSRESTISAEDNQELARQALQSIASRASQPTRGSGSGSGSASHRTGGGADEEEVYESQASQAASEMLRRDPRESFEVAASVAGGSRDGTPAAADRSAKLQAKLFGGVNKSGLSSQGAKRKLNGAELADGYVHDPVASPTKKLREVGGLREPARVGLGIRYGREC